MTYNLPLMFCIALAVFFGIGLAIILQTDRRSLAAGTFAAGEVMALAMLVGVILIQYTNRTVSHHAFMVRFLTILFLAFVLFVFLALIAVMIMLIWNGITLIRREGFSLGNLGEVGLGLAMLFFPLINAWVIPHVRDRPRRMAVYLFISLCLLWLVFLFLMYMLTAFLNLVNPYKLHLDYVVVLGAGLLNGDRVSPLLAARIKKGVKLWRKHPGSKLIMSGGQGPGEKMPEAVAMKNYAVTTFHLLPDQVMTETESRTTYENLLFSSKLMAPGARFALVTNSYHVYRALVLAKRLGLDCVGYGAKTKWYFTLNAFLREFIAYLRITWRMQSVIIVLNAVFTLAVYYLANYR